MSSAEERFHEEWLGMVQPVDGLVVSIPVLVEAQCLARQPAEVQRQLASVCVDADGGTPAIADVPGFLEHVLGWSPAWLQTGDALPPELSLYVPEGGQVIRPTAALRELHQPAPDQPGLPPRLLFWDLGPASADLRLDKPETLTGPWEYPVSAKFDRLLRHARVPIGVLTNRTSVRLLYAPHGESSGSITFRVADMLEVGGRPILDALIMLLGAARQFSVDPAYQLPAILAESRKRQANVTNELADQVFDALQLLLAGFEAAAERDGRAVLDAAYARPGDHLYGGLLTQLLRLVFVLYAEDRGLLPVEHELYAEHLSVLGLFEELQADHGAHPDSMSRRFGAYGRLCALCRAIYLGVEHGDLRMPARRGQLFSPQSYPFLEGWDGEPGAAPIVDAAARAATRVPSIDDETVFRVLEKLLVLRRQRLSYRALDVEQIGSVYEALMGYHVVRLEAEAVCLRPSRVWLTGAEVLAEKPATRARWLQETTGLAKGPADKLAKALHGATRAAEVLDVLDDVAVKGVGRRAAGRLVIQPGPERRRTSSHYTPRSLTAPIVAKTLEPLFRAMGEQPPSERILNLKVCDPAMGSGAFLVEACRYLADQVVLAWTREGRHDLLAGAEDATLLARRLVAQRCLYGVDKNGYAVHLAKLSLWLVTLARDLPFTFVDHALRHGDSLVGLSFEQITAFHWRPEQQLELCQAELQATLDEAIGARQRILELAGDPTPAAQKEKEWLLRDAEDALDRVRLIGDLVVGAFFAADKDKEREKERDRRLDLVLGWLRRGGEVPRELAELREEIRARTPVFHWMAEFPEVFWLKRPDPLDDDRQGGQAWIDAFVGNPPFLGGVRISSSHGDAYKDWLAMAYPSTGHTDLSVYFIRRTVEMLGNKGAVGLVVTNSVSQGGNRDAGLGWAVGQGVTIYSADRSLPWPGEAAVSVSVVHMVMGIVVPRFVLDGVVVPRISSGLSTRATESTAERLSGNEGRAVIGSYVLGIGFVFDDKSAGATPIEVAERLLAADSRNRARILRYLGGEDLMTSPTQTSNRYVIDFGDLSEDEAKRWPELYDIVRAKVKPARAQVEQRDRREEWWRHATRSPVLRTFLESHDRVLATSQVTSHLALTFVSRGAVLSHTCVAFLFDRFCHFAVLQSRLHLAWAVLHASSLKTWLRYTPTACFENYPFPTPTPATVIPDLDPLGESVYSARVACMRATDQGLTQLYNNLKDPDCHDPAIVALRALHLDLDRAVLTAYGWADLIPLVPPYTTPTTDAEKRAFSAFEDAVIDRLFALNAERAAAERAAAAAAAPAAKAPRAKGASRAKKPKATGQLALAPEPTRDHDRDPTDRD